MIEFVKWSGGCSGGFHRAFPAQPGHPRGWEQGVYITIAVYLMILLLNE